MKGLFNFFYFIKSCDRLKKSNLSTNENTQQFSIKTISISL